MAAHLAELAGLRAAAQLTAEPAPQTQQLPQAEPPEPPPPGSTDYTLVFARLARIAHVFVALESRLIATQPCAANPQSGHRVKDDSRDRPLARAFDFASRNHPRRTEITRQASDLLYVDLFLDPEEKRPIEEVFESIARSLQLQTKFSEIPLNILHPAVFPPPPTAPDDLDDLSRLACAPSGFSTPTPAQTHPPIPPF
jgi:hypothetical protein